MTTTSIMAQVRAANGNWFSRGNKKFFGDLNYRVLYGKATGERYLVRATEAWTDMFGGPKRVHYRVNRINDDLTIGKLLDNEFSSLPSVKEWLKSN